MQRYNLHEELGKGSFGTVFRATKKDDPKQEVSSPRREKDVASLLFWPSVLRACVLSNILTVCYKATETKV